MTAHLAIDGPAAPPRSNGELVFAAHWESRAFGMAVSLHEAGAFEWATFQAALIAPGSRPGKPRRRASGATTSTGSARSRTCSPATGRSPRVSSTRAAVLAARPAGHDHGDHDHGDHGH